MKHTGTRRKSGSKESLADKENTTADALETIVALRSSGGGEHTPTVTEVIEKVRNGLRFQDLETLQRLLDVPMEQLAAKLGISRATLHRRKIAGRLETDESDKVMRYARLVRQAIDVFGSIEDARSWMTHPQFGLGNVTPLEYAQTEIGAREVENLLGRIEYGVYS